MPIPKRHSGRAQRDTTVIDRIKATICIGLVILGVMLIVPWLGFIGWVALCVVRYF